MAKRDYCDLPGEALLHERDRDGLRSLKKLPGVRWAFVGAFILGLVALVMQQTMIDEAGTGKPAAEGNPFRLLRFMSPQLRVLLAEYIRWFNAGRVHQGLHGIPDPDPDLALPKPATGRLVARPVLGGLHHDYRLVA